MAQFRIRFTSPDGTYRSGDIAQFTDYESADHYIARGVAVLHTGDGGDPDDRSASDIADQPAGPVNVQGRVEAHETRPGRSIVHSTEFKDEATAKKAADEPAPKPPSEVMKDDAAKGDKK